MSSRRRGAGRSQTSCTWPLRPSRRRLVRNSSSEEEKGEQIHGQCLIGDIDNDWAARFCHIRLHHAGKHTRRPHVTLDQPFTARRSGFTLPWLPFSNVVAHPLHNVTSDIGCTGESTLSWPLGKRRRYQKSYPQIADHSLLLFSPSSVAMRWTATHQYVEALHIPLF